MKHSREYRWRLAACLAVLLFAAACGCGSSGDDNADDATPTPQDDDDTGDDDLDGPTEDGRLYAAAGSAVITPDENNHPEPIRLGGVIPSRAATGVHDDLTASVLILATHETHVVFVALDLLGFTRTRGREIQERLALDGLDGEHVLIASTHTHEAPDTLGFFGPNLLNSGVSPAYIRFIQDTVVDLVLDTWTRLRPVTMRAALVPIDDPQSNERTLIADFREPRVTVPYLAAARFDADDGAPVATLVNWHSHPEVMIESTLVSADFPRWVRERVEQTTGGRAVYLSGAVGGLSSPTGVAVPARGEDGEPVHDDNGNAVYLVDGTWDKTRSLGFVIADLATNALDEALPIDAPSLFVHVEELPLPVRNPLMKAAFAVGLIEYDLADRVRLPECGWFGCLAERLALVRVGPVEIVSSPGEIFPETMIGREAETIDFGEGFGPFDFPAVAGYLEDSGAPVPMHMGLCGDEMGYLIPETDFHPRDHPDYYEEDLILGTDTETLYRDAVVRVLTAQGG